MDGKQFDQLMRSWFAGGTRRSLLQRLSTLPLATGLVAVLGVEEEGEARKRKNRRQSRHRRHHKNRDKHRPKHDKKCTKSGSTPKAGKPCCQGLTTDQNGQCSGAPPSPPPGPPPPPTPGCSNANPCANSQMCEAGTCVACDVCATGCQFTSVQAAIDDPSQLTTIWVCPGTYDEDLTIGRSLTLRGAGDGDGANDTIVDGSGADSVVTVTGGTVVLQRLRITGGDMPAPDDGGGVKNTGGADLTLDRCTIIGNHIPGDVNYGGGVFNDVGTTLHLTNCTVTGNDNDNGYGVGIANLGTATIDGCTISGNGLNSPGDPYGGGVYNGNSAGLTVTASTISDNFSSYGGGLYNDGGTMNVSGTTIRGNDSDGSEGGGIYNNFGSLTISACTIQNNTSASYGGGISSYDTLTISDTEISGHTVAEAGGGIYSSADLNLTNCTITNNSAPFGGGLYASGGTATILGSQLTVNHATNDGGGIWNIANVILTNTVVNTNTATGNGDDIFNFAGSQVTCTSGDTVGECVGGTGCNSCV